MESQTKLSELYQKIASKHKVPVSTITNLEHFIFSETRKQISLDDGKSIFINGFGTFLIPKYHIKTKIASIRRQQSEYKSFTERKFKSLMRKLYYNAT